ncbi:50S ribosomal protein L25 [Candidatus Gottesmanbacteria bacterium]|nr:50S ribosomal protein L25 [Candidatus Gottesmanbacteria bacterium]
MDKVTLNANKRTVVGRKVKQLRKEGLVPANIYGKKVKSQSVSVAEKEFSSIFSKVGETGLVELMLEKQSHPVLIHNVALHPVTGAPLHIDFFQVDLHEKVTTKVPLSFVGESPAVKDKLGVLLNILSVVEIEALPTDLPEKLEVDINGLKAVGDTLKVSDLKVSDKIKILSDVNLEVTKVAPLVSKEAEQMAKEEAEAKAAAAAEAATAAGAEGVVKPEEGAAPVKAPATGQPVVSPPSAPGVKKE